MEQTNDATRGGLAKGDKHSAPSGGIKAVVITDNNKPLLIEDGEVVINSEAVKLHWKELNVINQSAGNGVPIAKPVGGVAKTGGVINNDQETYLRWKSLVNMSASELKSFMGSAEGKKAGMTKDEADKLGIHNGQESARWIIKMKKTPVSKWTTTMWDWAKRQISFNSRMMGNKGPLFDENGNKTRKHLSLLIWGHNPQKFDIGGTIPQRSYLGEQGGSIHSSHLEQAKLLHEQNKDYSHTGWFINPHDKKWRFEISDKEMEIKPLVVGIYKLSDIISHPKLFKAYPDFKDIPLEIVDDSNMQSPAHVDTENETKIKYNIHGFTSLYNRRRDVRLSASDLNKNIFVHELQHIIQIREKLGGGCPQDWQFEQILYEQGLEERGLGKDQRDILWAEAGKRRLNSSGEIESMDVENRRELTDSERSAKKPLSSVNIDEKYLNVRMEMKIGGNIDNITNEDLAKNLINKLKDIGFQTSGNFAKSESSFGTSLYVIAIDDDNKEYKFRISDHSVTNSVRMSSEYHINKDNIDKRAEEAEKIAFPHRFDKTDEIYVSENKMGGKNEKFLQPTDKIISSEGSTYLVNREGAKGILRRKSMKTGGSITNTELDKALSDLHKAETTQATMKSANAIIRSKKDVQNRLVGLGLSEAQAEKLQTPDFAKRVGFPTYALTNNNASIKRLQDRVNMLEKKVEGAKAVSEGKEEKYSFDGGEIEINYALDRVQILFPGDRVDKELFKKLRTNGYVYSPTNLAFQRKITPQAISNAVHLFGAKRIGEEVKEEKSEDYESMLQKRNFSYITIYIYKALSKGYAGPTHFNLVVFELRKDLVINMVKEYLKEHVPGLDIDKVEVSVYPKTYIQEAKKLYKEGAYLPSTHPAAMVLGNLQHSVKNFLAMEKDMEEPKRNLPAKQYVTVSQSYFTVKDAIGEVLSKPNMFVQEIYFGKDKAGKDMIAKVDNNYITKISVVPEVVIDGKSEKFVMPKEVVAELQKDIKPITQLGTGANVYFQSNKYRVNDFKGKYLLIVGDQNSEFPIQSISFDNLEEAIFVAEKLQGDAPQGLDAKYHFIDKIIQGFRDEFEVKGKENVETLLPNTPEEFDEAIMSQLDPHEGWVGSLMKERAVVKNLLPEWQSRFAIAIKEFGITEIFVDPQGELHITSSYDIPQDYYQSIKKEVMKKTETGITMIGAEIKEAVKAGYNNVITSPTDPTKCLLLNDQSDISGKYDISLKPLIENFVADVVGFPREEKTVVVPANLTDKMVYDNAVEVKGDLNDKLSRLYAKRDFLLHGSDNEKIKETIDIINSLQEQEVKLDEIIANYGTHGKEKNVLGEEDYLEDLKELAKSFTKEELAVKGLPKFEDTAVIFKGVSHSYKNQYELNKAIEALITTKTDSYNSDEKNFIRKYSGYGGLDKYGPTGKGGYFEYYTPKEVIEKMWGLAYKYGYKNGSMLETSIGIGEFLQYAPKDIRMVGYEISEFSAKICKILYPTVEIHVQPFEKLFIKNNFTMKDKIDSLEKFDLVIGNPPYGPFTDVASRYMTGMGEKDHTKAHNYVEYFIRRGLDLLNPGGLLVYIVGSSIQGGGKMFLDGDMTPVKEYLAANCTFLDAYRLPDSIFERTGVTADVIVLKKN